MRRIVFLTIICSFAFASCNNSPKVMTYADAERQFVASLTNADTLEVQRLGQIFMDNVQAGNLDLACNMLTTIYNNVLYKISVNTVQALKERFTAAPVKDYAFLRMSFSTQGNNDLVYRYAFDGDIDNGMTIKIYFNPVKIGDTWYLSLKDGGQSSMDQLEKDRVNPLSPAPNPIRLNKKEN